MYVLERGEICFLGKESRLGLSLEARQLLFSQPMLNAMFFMDFCHRQSKRGVYQSEGGLHARGNLLCIFHSVIYSRFPLDRTRNGITTRKSSECSRRIASSFAVSSIKMLNTRFFFRQ